MVEEYYRLRDAKEEEEQVEQRKKERSKRSKKSRMRISPAQDKYNERMEELNELLKEGSISLEEFEDCRKKAYDELVAASDKWFDGAVRALDKYAEEATDMAANVERVVTNAMQGWRMHWSRPPPRGKFGFKGWSIAFWKMSPGCLSVPRIPGRWRKGSSLIP